MEANWQKTTPDMLLRRCRGGDQRAWNQLIDRYKLLARSVCTRVGLRSTDCEDVVQDTFIALYKNIDRVRSAEALASWVAVTATRLARRVVASSGKTVMLEDADLLVAAPDAQPEDGTKRVLEMALDEMSAEGAELLRMLFIEGLSYAEVSDRTGKPLGSIGPTRQRCLTRLREVVDRELVAA